MRLIIVEKPLAGERIAKILGNPRKKLINKILCWETNYGLIFPLKGHIIDVDFPEEFRKWDLNLEKLINSDLRTVERYKNICDALRYLAPYVSEIIIATDNDREGESIGLEAVEIIKEINPNVKIYRARFSAITEKDIKKAFSKLENPNYNLASAAWARRDIDLYWGATLTRWLSVVSGCRGKDFLSVGRVQTPTLKLVVDREREIENFKPEIYYKLVYIVEGKKFYYEKKLSEKEAKELLNKIKNLKAEIYKQETKEIIPRPTPFNTTEFLKEATKLGFSADEAMKIAENLYMKGYISYPRTDTNVYPETLNLEEKVRMLFNTPYKELAFKVYPPKRPSYGKSKKDDHPPIHPVGYGPMDEKEKKIYDLIVRRFLATVYVDCIVNKTKIILDFDGIKFVGEFRKVIEKGWTEIYPKEIQESEPPKSFEGTFKIEKHKTKPPERYSQGDLIKKMETLNLGTKSTRHEIIKKLYERRYITGSKKIKPTELGKRVIEIFEKLDNPVIYPDMTAELEKNMDEIEKGNKTKEDVVNLSRNLLKEVVKKLLENQNVGKEIFLEKYKDKIFGECECRGKLILMISKRKKRYLKCSSCGKTFPLPQKGELKWIGDMKVLVDNKWIWDLKKYY
jgi:DNA topoisomerase-1